MRSMERKRTVRSVLGSSRRRYVAAFSILLVVLALLTSGMDCDDGYQLTVSSTGGGSVTHPGEGTRSYNAGTVVELVATPEEGYEFGRWNGHTEHIADINAPSTTITMNGDYSIEASFRSEGEGDRDRPPDVP